ncbi:MAG TPA: DUF2249 domain-containing protein [Ottowia sp.]|jgi:uncharacterized protein (DUF2249 family)|uniref:DUF2249 domain-containing protein n=1 Tax=Thermomonas sp. TaxID=1971895 RepID=UPI00096207CD|nr:DUF2249 domain-containing protein [Ottowia sp.]OJV56192.1 MAG: aminotransferase [Burkholderiales bacterium 68-10]HMT16959.1 DUF2249 domain-containing protein [Ottowia sp.]HMT63778.1 DUF2249 domain-containing protein [Ottowia sp.]HMT83016.1 DUF2249 domain-containing protein [Ottowia sp.]
MSTATLAEIDVRSIPPYQRHQQIFAQVDALQVGQSLRIVNDHDPVPLRHQLESRSPGQLQWSYVQAGPQLWRVQISKVQGVADADQGSCCSGGACGG